MTHGKPSTVVSVRSACRDGCQANTKAQRPNNANVKPQKHKLHNSTWNILKTYNPITLFENNKKYECHPAKCGDHQTVEHNARYTTCKHTRASDVDRTRYTRNNNRPKCDVETIEITPCNSQNKPATHTHTYIYTYKQLTQKNAHKTEHVGKNPISTPHMTFPNKTKTINNKINCSLPTVTTSKSMNVTNTNKTPTNWNSNSHKPKWLSNTMATNTSNKNMNCCPIQKSNKTLLNTTHIPIDCQIYKKYCNHTLHNEIATTTTITTPTNYPIQHK